MINGDYELIYNSFSPDFKSQISLKDLAEMGAGYTTDVKSFQQHHEFKLNGANVITWIDPSGLKAISALFGENDSITGMLMQPLTPATETDNKLSKLEYSLPFKGDWFVFWGGNNVLANYHYAHESQRYAYDFVQEKDGLSYEGDPTKNDSYFAFGQEVHAPADGTVVSVVNDIVDNEPVGVMNEKEPFGNVIVIDHGGEYSVLAHLKKDSVSVKPGDVVKRGQLVAQLGNSGNSSEAHMHFQVNDGKDLNSSKSINVQWKGIKSPVRGETVSN
ncbi:M23 family metallopeptidase [Paenibacillus sp. GSMTC-2017]|nr:M23 family metallopeptidase [Paenibacillus sp. GSMTC-2017]